MSYITTKQHTPHGETTLLRAGICFYAVHRFLILRCLDEPEVQSTSSRLSSILPWVSCILVRELWQGTHIFANKIIFSVGTVDIDIRSIYVVAYLESLFISAMSPSYLHRIVHTSGLEHTIDPTSGSSEPDVTPSKFLKWISEMVRLLCLDQHRIDSRIGGKNTGYS